jgi:hypothetical protein
MEAPAAGPRTFPCVFPGWDSSPRSSSATIIQNGDPRLYGEWLCHALWRVAENGKDERPVFINAWNEWAEGCSTSVTGGASSSKPGRP